ncbi:MULTISPECIES: DUF488 domain-containing protein [Halomonas]|uniref:DUF488 domain-containing protein n=1 Tax=Halomonas TaxID=2745 RepID=UPI0002F71DE0|nr:DUF488 family protein [Halomonas smyrnensis]
MNIITYRIYDDEPPSGYRALVDRLWPRGVSKEEAHLDGHWKELAPSDDLRKWFSHDPEKWGEFRKQYMSELSNKKDDVKKYLSEVDRDDLVLLYGAKDKKHSHAHVLKEYMEKLGQA